MLISKANRNEVYKYLFKGNTCYAISLSSLALKWIDQNSFIIITLLSLMMCTDFCSRSLLISFCDV